MSEIDENVIYNPTVEVPDNKTRPRSGLDPRVRVFQEFDPELRRTKQSFEEESNINYVVAKYRQTGVLPTARKIEYGNENQYEFHQKQLALANLKSKYYELSPDTQAQFAGVDDFLDACLDPGRAEELYQADQSEGNQVPGDSSIPQGHNPPPADPPAEPESDDDDD